MLCTDMGLIVSSLTLNQQAPNLRWPGKIWPALTNMTSYNQNFAQIPSNSVINRVMQRVGDPAVMFKINNICVWRCWSVKCLLYRNERGKTHRLVQTQGSDENVFTKRLNDTPRHVMFHKRCYFYVNASSVAWAARTILGHVPHCK